jgi:hypothetical protein
LPHDRERRKVKYPAGAARSFRRRDVRGTDLARQLPLSFFFGTSNVNTLPAGMLKYMQNNFDPSIAAVSVLQMLIAVATLLVLDRVYGIKPLTAI